jgi:beta-lactamase class A
MARSDDMEPAVIRIAGFLFSRAGRAWRAALVVFLIILVCGGGAVLRAKPPLALQTPPPARFISRPRSDVPAPAGLQAEISALAAGYGEPVGIAVTDLEEGWTVQSSGEIYFPQQSVSKLWIALTLLDQVDHGAYRLQDPVVMRDADLSVFFQPIHDRYGPDGYATTFEDLLARALIESDNAAADRLVRQVGGAGAIRQTLARKGIAGIDVGGEERELQSRIAGLTWRPEYGLGGAFKTARAQLSPEVRDAALAAYLAQPPDGAAPLAIVQALSALQRGELLSPESTQRLIGLMAQATTGPQRLKGGLPPDWTIAHKTGTGQDWRSASVGINDVGLITAPGGRVYAVAVMIRRTARPVPERLAFMQSISAALVRHWRSEVEPPY